MAEYTQEERDALESAFAEATEKLADAQKFMGNQGIIREEPALEEARLKKEVARLKRQRADAVVVDRRKSYEFVAVGAHVTVDALGVEATYCIYDDHKGAPFAAGGSKVLSTETPLGAALMGHKAGIEVSYNPPNGAVIQATIVKVW